MASTNQSPFYQKAEEEYLKATSDQERLECLEIMMKEVPKHKSSEKMRKNLTNRYKKLKSSMAKQKKSGKGGHAGIKKADMQCVLAGFPNVGKSTIFKTLTSQVPKISPHEFTTYQPQLGTFHHEDAQIQIIDIPSFPNHDKSLINSTDTLLLVIDNLSQIKKIKDFCYRSKAKIILIFNKEDKLSETEKRKTKATLNSKFKKYNYTFFSSSPTALQTKKLKQKIFDTFPIIRIYTKEPKKEPSKEPMILKEKSNFRDAAEKVRKGLSKKIKRSRIWGPSSKFGGQVIGLNHVLKDKDIIEFLLS